MDRRSFLRRGAISTAVGLAVTSAAGGVAVAQAKLPHALKAPVNVDQELDPILRGLVDENIRFELRYYQRWAYVWTEVVRDEVRVDLELDPLLRPATYRRGPKVGAPCEFCDQFHEWYVHGCAPVAFPISWEPVYGWAPVAPAEPGDVPLAISQECPLKRLGPHVHTDRWIA